MATSIQQQAANQRFSFTSAGYPELKTFSVIRMIGFEAISKPFRFTLTLVSSDANIDFDTVLLKPAEFRIYAPDGASYTPYYGITAEFEQLQKSGTYVFYRAVLVPRMWQLSLYQASEAYLDTQSIVLTLDSMLKSVLNGSENYRFDLTGSYRNRDFVCQYQETHLDFFSRWLEKEGMCFYFDHDDSRDKLVVADDCILIPKEVIEVIYSPVDKPATGIVPNHVQNFVCRQKPLPKQVVLRGYNYLKASVDFKMTAPVSDNGIGEVKLHAENFLDEDEGKRYAKLRAEQIICGGRVFSGESTAVGLRSGYFMKMTEHYRDDFNVDYLVTEIQHEGSQAAALLAGIKTAFNQGEGGETIYRNNFQAIPSKTQFRPELSTAWPRLPGTMSATIDTEGASTHADLDGFGQYKVKLPFGSSDKALGKGSARVRMASTYSGGESGIHFPLLKGAEVLLSFINGNPDEPIIVGAVPNSENKNVVNNTNPYENKILTAGGNLMYMGDKPEKQAVWLHSPKLNTTVGLGAVASRDVNKDTDTADATKPNMREKIAAILIPPVSFRISTAGSSETLYGGSNTGVSRGRNYVNLQGDSTVTMLSSSKMTYKGTFDWSPKGEFSYRDERVVIDRLDNFVLANNVIRQGNDTLRLSGGRETANLMEKTVTHASIANDALKKLYAKSGYLAHAQLAVKAALAVKDVVLVNLGDEKKDPLKTPGLAKTITSPLFTVLDFTFSKLMQFMAGKMQQATFVSNLTLDSSGVYIQGGAASVSIKTKQPGRNGPAKSPSGIINAAKNWLFWKPDPEPKKLLKTENEILSTVNGANCGSYIKQNDTEISSKLIYLNLKDWQMYKSEFFLSEKNAFLSTDADNSSISFDCDGKKASLKLNKDGIQVSNFCTVENANLTSLSILKKNIIITAGQTINSKLDISSDAVVLTSGSEEFTSKLKLQTDSAGLSRAGAGLIINANGITIKPVAGKLIKFG